MTQITRRDCLRLAALAAAGTALGTTTVAAAAEAQPRPPTAKARTVTDYGSGVLGAWTGLGHTLTTNWATADVAVVGDSITNRGWAALNTALAKIGKTLAVDGWSGRPTAPAVDALLARPALPPILVMACGTNDIFSPPGMITQVQRVKAGAPAKGVEHILWVDVQCSRWSQTAAVQIADQRNSGWVNNQIHETIPGQVVPWAWYFSSAPSRLTTYLEDGVHPKMGTGTEFWRSVLMASITPLL